MAFSPATYTVGINPLPFCQNNKPIATEEELISDPKTQLPLLSLPGACGEGSQHSLLAWSWCSLTHKQPTTLDHNLRPCTIDLQLTHRANQETKYLTHPKKKLPGILR